MSLIVNSKNTVADNNGLNLSLNKPKKELQEMAAASTASKCKSSAHSIDAILGIRAAAAAQAAQASLANTHHHLFTNNSLHHSTGKIFKSDFLNF